MENAITWAGSLDTSIWVAVIAGAVALVTSWVALTGHRKTRESAEEVNHLKALEISMNHFPKEIERLNLKVDRQEKRYDELEAKVNQLQEEAEERESLLKRFTAYVRQLWHQLAEAGITPLTPPDDLAAELAADK